MNIYIAIGVKFWQKEIYSFESSDEDLAYECSF